MQHPIAPIPCKPWTLNGLSDRLIVDHYENVYGAAVRALNEVLGLLAAADIADMPAHEIRSLKQEEARAAGSGF
jgi:Fe-Mn family superoxide dismutase